MRAKKLKLTTANGQWVVEDDGCYKIFDNPYEAWLYIFFLKEIRPKAPWTPKSPYSVNSLVPTVPKKLVRVSLQN